MSSTSLSELGSMLALVNERASFKKDPSKPYLGLEHIPSNGSRPLGTASASDSISTNNQFRDGDILFGKLRPRLHKSIRVGFSGYCSTDILVLRTIEPNCPAFAGYTAQSDGVFAAAIRTEEGTKMPRCSWSDVRKAKVYSPTPSEQNDIAQVLTTIDEAIEQTESLIAKTQKIKAGLMHDLFTRGVTENGELRPPRSEAPHLYKESPLGWIPKEWSTATLDEIRDPKRCITYGVLKPGPYIENGIPLLQIEDVIHGVLDFSKVHRISHQLDNEYSRTNIFGGEIVISLVGTIGRVAILDKGIEKSNLHRNLGLVSLTEDEQSKFIFHFMLTDIFRQSLSATTLGSTQSLLNLKSLRAVSTPVVSPDERRAITDALDSVDATVSIELREYAKLIQFKSGLMHDLLTGKVRVPEGAVRV